MRAREGVVRLAGKPATYLSLAMAILLAHQLFYYGELGRDVVDDAYISFRYAQNLARGHGLVFNIGERVEGYTNFLWTVLLSLFIRLDLEPGLAAIVVGALFGWGALALTYRLARVAFPEGGVVAGAALLLAVDGSFALWSVAGMETAIFTVLLLAGMIAYLGEKEREGFVLSGLLFALAAMTRPEGLLVFGVTLVHRALYRSKREGRLVRGADLGRVLVFLAIYAPYFLWRYRYYGYLLPNTFYAKVATEGVSAQIGRGWKHLTTFLGLHLGWLLLPLAAVPLFKRRGFALTYLTSSILLYAAYIVYVGGDWSVGRFLVPLLPAFYLLVATGGEEVYLKLRALGERKRLEGVVKGGSVFLLLVGSLFLFRASSLGGEDALFIRRFQAAEATRARVTLGRWLRENVPPDTFIAVDAAGQIPYYSELRTLDMFGVNDEHTAHLKVETMGQGTPGHEKFDFNYIMGRRPDLIIVYGNFLDGSDIYERADDWNWTEEEALRQFLTIYRRRDWEA